MKIHYSVLDHLLLTQSSSISSSVGKKTTEDIATSSLSVSLGLGNGRDVQSSPVHERLQEELLQKPPHEVPGSRQRRRGDWSCV